MWERCCSNASKSSELTWTGPNQVQISSLDLLALMRHRSHIQCKLLQVVWVYRAEITILVQDWAEKQKKRHEIEDGAAHFDAWLFVGRSTTRSSNGTTWLMQQQRLVVWQEKKINGKFGVFFIFIPVSNPKKWRQLIILIWPLRTN